MFSKNDLFTIIFFVSSVCYAFYFLFDFLSIYRLISLCSFYPPLIVG